MVASRSSCWITGSLAALLVTACGAETGAPGAGASGGGASSGHLPGAGGSGGSGSSTYFPDLKPGATGTGTGDGSDMCGTLTAILRDFKDDHPDFEKYLGDQRGMVQPTLDGDKLPVYALDKATMITSTQTFAQWYRDVDGVNQRTMIQIPLTQEKPGVFAFENNSFFPLDGKLLGNQGRPHNYHFTTEIRATFTYKGGEVFTFKGDDDVFAFVNGKLALDIGGVHKVESATIDFDAKASELGIEKGKTYRLDVFHAERHTTESNFRIETSIECLQTPPVL
jgi:fibro-slime domain-containing protein